MLLYSLLHLTGYDLPIEQLKNFRQLHSKTAGHPEASEFPAIETTTGPLGQGFANAVGMALAEKVLAERFNKPGHEIVDHRTYVFMGDGCLMEGISHEVASLAGTLKLGKLVAIYDDNGISIDGEVHGWFTDDTPKRFESYGWHVIRGVDGHDADAVKAAIAQATKTTDKPTLICCKTIIGFGAPNKQGKESSHGAALGVGRSRCGAQIARLDICSRSRSPIRSMPAGTRSPKVPNAKRHGMRSSQSIKVRMPTKRRSSSAASPVRCRRTGTITPTPTCASCRPKVRPSPRARHRRWRSTRSVRKLPELIGGSADLAGSNLTIWKGSKDVNANDAHANYVYYGVREFGMSAISNGLALHGGFIPYDATFLVFSDYARNAVRMSALIPAHAIHVYTHDSIGLGEDGPTHQPIEHVASLRLIPRNHVWRPCDAVESAVAWKAAIERKDGPSCLIFSRQNLPHQARSDEQLGLIELGGYVLSDPNAKFDAILIATGSEIDLAMKAMQALAKQGIAARVVSMPCANVFDRQPQAYRDAVLPPDCRRRVAIEAGVTDYWRKYVGLDGAVVGIDTFGASAPAEALFKHFGFTVDNVVDAVKNISRR